MKCSELSAMFRSLNRLLLSIGREASSDALHKLSELLQSYGDKPIGSLLKSLSALRDVAPAHSAETSVAPMVDLLDALSTFSALYAKPAVAKDIASVCAALQSHRPADLDALIVEISTSSGNKGKPSPPPPRPEVIRQWHKRLEEALGDDEGFLRIHGALKQDKSVTAAEVTAIAKAFAFESVKSRPAALKKILSRHTNLMVSKAKEAATAGRIAG